MSRKAKQLDFTRARTANELDAVLSQGLDTLEQLSSVFDGGYSPIAFLMAVEINKILVENDRAIKSRGTIKFRSWAVQENEENLLPQSSLISMEYRQEAGSRPGLVYEPNFKKSDEWRELPFREWWSREIIWRAGAALPGTPGDLIPVNGAPSVPFNERVKYSRREMIKLLRDKMGAHVEKDVPHLLEELQSHQSWGVGVVIETPHGVFSTSDGTMNILITPVAAMVRQIAHELLTSYGRLG